MQKLCSVDDCGRPAEKRGWCQRHYMRWQRHGDATALVHAAPGTVMAWITDHAEYNEDQCLTWPFAKTVEGYGNLWIGVKHTASYKHTTAHRVMCELVHGTAPTPKHEVAHNCGKGHEGCVNPKHLRWATRRENHADKKIHGTSPAGERNARSKLTEAQVREIRRLVKTTVNQQLAERFGVSAATISLIKHRKHWPTIN